MNYFLAIVVYDEGRTSPVVTFFISRKLRCPAIIVNAAEFNGARVESTRNVFCFVEGFANIKEALQYVTTHNFDGKFSFVISTPVTNRAWLNDALGYIWRWKILNFVVVYELDGRVEIVGYNPFQNRILNHSDVHSGKNVFPDKLANLWGYKLTSAMNWDFPRHRMVNGVLWGKDVNLFKEIAQSINATPIVLMLQTIAEVTNAVANHTANLSFNRKFLAVKNKQLINYCYALEFAYMSVLVPTPDLKPQYLCLIDIFNSNLHVCILATLVFVIGFTYCFKQFSLGESTALTAQIFLEVSCPQLANARFSLKFFLMSWVFFSMILGITFNAKLLSFLVTPRYSNEITTLEGLASSKLPIGSNLQFDTLSDDYKMFKEQLVDVMVLQTALKYKKDKALIIQSSFADIIQRKRDQSNRQIYKKLDEPLAAGHSIYIFEENSPFKAKFETLLLLFRECGLGMFGIDYIPTEVVQENHKVPLSLLHLQAAFYIVCFGLLLSLIVFGAELAYQQKLKKRIY